MPAGKKRLPAVDERPMAERAGEAVERLRALATPATRQSLARYAIPSDNAFGVKMGDLQALAKALGRDHALAAALWDEPWYEARLLAAYVDDPAAVDPAQMEAWCAAFDSWAVCDTVCFALFSYTPHAWDKVEAWAAREEEFVKRAAFALLASLVLRDRKAGDARFGRGLELIEVAAADSRNFVKKSVNWALRTLGKKNPALHEAALEVALRLAASPEAAPRWVGKDAARELRSPAVLARLAGKKS